MLATCSPYAQACSTDCRSHCVRAKKGSWRKLVRNRRRDTAQGNACQTLVAGKIARAGQCARPSTRQGGECPPCARSGQSGIHWVRIMAHFLITSLSPLSPQPVREEDLEGHVARSAMTRHTPRPPLDCRWRQLSVHRIVDVTSPIAPIERRTVVAGKRQVASQPFGQIRIGDEVAAEGDEVGVARCDDCRGTLTRETTRRDQCTAEFSPQ